MVSTSEAHESVDVRASIDWTYAAWIEFTDLPLSDVDPLKSRDGRFRPGTSGLLGASDAEITAHEPNQLIAWRTEGEPGAVEGIVRFIELGPAETRVDVALALRYEASPGAAGDRLSSKEGLREDLVRFKAQAESASPGDFTQTTPADAGDVPRTPAGASVAASLELEASPAHRDAVTDDIARAAGVDERELRKQGLRPSVEPQPHPTPSSQ
jgi:hypothetical protein